MKRLPEIYAGIGSRRTPPDVLDLMATIAYHYAKEDVILRSGRAPGADQAFEYGASMGKGEAEIYLPWKSFEEGPFTPRLTEPSEQARQIAARYHPNWRRLSQGVRKLQARNTHQVLGVDCESPCALVICWTPDGSMGGEGPDTGGTGQAIRIAAAHQVPVVNLQNDDLREMAERTLSDLERISYEPS